MLKINKDYVNPDIPMFLDKDKELLDALFDKLVFDTLIKKNNLC